MQETIKRVMATALSVGAIAGAVSEAPAARGEDAPATVTCRVRDDGRGREFVLRQAGSPSPAGGAAVQSWQLSMRDSETNEAWIDLRLPGARPAITHTSATLSYRNANGGRQVDLDVSAAGARLDVWVDHGLDVNIEPDLDPRVDRLNTDGALTALQCAIDVGAASPRE